MLRLLLALFLGPLLTGCAALSSPAAKTAYDVVLPYAKDVITRYFDSQGKIPDVEEGGCIDEPIEEFDEDGYTWFLCRGKPVE